jgi:hypothetical protein
MAAADEIGQSRGTGTYVAVGTAASNFAHDIKVFYLPTDAQ